MAEFQLPEMLRTPLEELVLQIKVLQLGYVQPFLQKAIEPPEEKAVKSALQCLRDLVSEGLGNTCQLHAACMWHACMHSISHFYAQLFRSPQMGAGREVDILSSFFPFTF